MSPAKPHPYLTRLRKLSASYPETAEVEAWGHPTFRVRGKIFASFGEHEGAPRIGCKQTRIDQSVLTEDPRFQVAPYVGKHGWIVIRIEDVPWDMVADLVDRSYRLIAPKSLVKGLEREASGEGGA